MHTLLAPTKILVRAVNWLGDAVMTTPALSAIRQTWPTAEIVLLANPLVSQLFIADPRVDRVLSFNRQGAEKGVMGRLRLAHRLRKERFDLAILLPNSFDSALVPWMAGIPVRLGKASDGRSLLLSGRYHPSGHGKHEVFDYLQMLQHFGISGDVVSPQLFTTLEEDQTAAILLSNNGIAQQERVLGINAGATYGSAKRWYPERFAQVAAKLAERWNARIVLFGGPGEVELVAAIERELAGNCVNVAGKTSVRQLMALLKRCDFLVTNDSGPMHIAAAFGVPLVAIFGPTDHTGTAPCSDRAIVVRTPVDCAPCKLRECPTDHRCMTGVTVEQVLQAAEQLWEPKK